MIVGSVGLNGLIGLDLDGGEGNDLLIGGDGLDFLRGGAGNDTILGGRGNDVALGQDGDDLFIVNEGDGSDVMEGGAGNDTVQVNGSNTAGDVILVTPNGSRVHVKTTAPHMSLLDVGTVENLELDTRGGNDRVKTGSFAATTTTTLRTITFKGGAGNDIFDGSTLPSFVSVIAFGGDGNDILIGGWGNDVLRGEAGDDFLNGGPGNDIGDGGAGVDIAVACELLINIP